MMAAVVDQGRWPRRRWWLAIGLVLVLQIGLVFWLGDRSPVAPRTTVNPLAVYLVEDALARLPTLADPLLFSPANPHGFSGPLWLNTPKLEYHLSDWTSPPSLLTLQTQQLGNAFSKFVPTNTTTAFTVADNPEPHMASPELFLPDTPVPAQSTWWVEGELAQRPLISPLTLTNWPHTNILTNSVVQVVVDLDGHTVSAKLLSKCGLEKADKHALDVARALRYQSIRGNVPGQSTVATLQWGKLVFHWHTVALPATNPPPQKP